MGWFSPSVSIRRRLFSRKIKEVEGHKVERSIFGNVKRIGNYKVNRTWYGGIKDDSPVSNLARLVKNDDRRLARKKKYPWLK